MDFVFIIFGGGMYRKKTVGHKVIFARVSSLRLILVMSGVNSPIAPRLAGDKSVNEKPIYSMFCNRSDKKKAAIYI